MTTQIETPSALLDFAKPGDVVWKSSERTYETVAAIEYDRGGRPCCVFTRKVTDFRGRPWYDPSKERPFGIAGFHYSIDWCRRDKQLYWHNTGGGFDTTTYHVAKFTNPVPPKARLWMAPGVSAVAYVGRDWKRTRKVGDAELLRRGYKRIAKPLDLSRFLSEWERNKGVKIYSPIDVAQGDTECEYCATCRDYLPAEGDWLCDHVHWCEECCWWVRDVKGGHVRLDGSRDEVETHPCDSDDD